MPSYPLKPKLYPCAWPSFDLSPAVKNLRVHAAKVRNVVRGTITYSIEMVTLGESSLSGPKRAAALADYIDHLMRPVVAAPEPKLHMTPARLDSTLAEIRRQKTLLDALSAAQPIIDGILQVDKL